MMNTAEKPSVAPAFVRKGGLDNAWAYMGSTLSFLLDAEETGGGLTFLMAHSRKGSEPPPHVHAYEQEVFYMLEGELEIFVEGVERSMVARPGDTIFLPSEKAHAFYFQSSEVRFVGVVHATDGHHVRTESYLKKQALGKATTLELSPNAERYASMGADEMEQAAKMAADHDVTFLSAEETSRRLPSYAGFGANLS